MSSHTKRPRRARTQAQRRNKENWKIKKMEAEEAERRRIDNEEAELQKKLRIEAIKRANGILYEQTDRMKGLRSAQMYSDVLQDRREQAEERRIKSKWSGQDDKKYFAHMMQSLEAAKEKDKVEERKRREKSEYIARMQQEQLALNQRLYVEALKKDKEEGEEIARKAQEDIRAEAEKQAARSMRARMAAEEMQLANQNLKKLQLELSLQDEEEEAYRQAELKRKEDLAIRRKALETKRFQEKQAIRQRMIDRACEELAKQKNSEDRIMEKQAQEARDKQDQEMAMREDKRRRQMEAIARSRDLQMRLKDEKKKKEYEEAIALVEAYKEKVATAEEAEAGEVAEVRRRNLELRATHEAQAAEKQQWLEAERQAALHADARTKAVLAEDSERFEKMAMEVMEQAHRDNKNTIPIKKVRACSSFLVDVA